MADTDRMVNVNSSLSSPATKSAMVQQAFELAEAAERYAVQALAALKSSSELVKRSESVLLEVQQAYTAIEDMIANGGMPGAQGEPGQSAYQLAVVNGFVGSEYEWLLSLEGEDGQDGATAYEVAVANGFVGTQPEWLASLKGIQGDPGLPGEPGAAATIQVGSVVSGGTASVTNVGTSAAAVLSFVLPKGDKGDKGTTGDTGAAATLELGTVTSVPSGTPASATMTGTPQARVLNLALPQGEQGPRGIQGPKGADGVGLPPGGAPGQVLAKLTLSNYEAQWINPPQGGGTGEDTDLRTKLTNGTANTVASGAVSYQLPDGGAKVSLTSALNDVFTSGRLLKDVANIKSFLAALKQAVPPSTGDNTRPTNRPRALKMNIGPGIHEFFNGEGLLVDIDGLEVYGAGQGVTELRFNGGGKFQIGVDADTNAGIKNVKGMLMRDMSLTFIGPTVPMITPTMPDGVLSIRMLAYSKLENLYIKDISPENNTGGIYCSGYQWIEFDHVNAETFGRYALMLDSQSPETWEVLAKFNSCQFLLGDTYDAGISASVYVHQTGRFRTAEFSALGVEFNNTHFALYPGNGNYDNESRAIYVDPALSGVDLGLSFTGDCLFENHKHFIECKKDSVWTFDRPKFFGNSRTQEIIRDDNYQGKWTFISPWLNNCASGMRQLGITTILGSGKVSGVPRAVALRPNGNLRIHGNLAGYKHDFNKTFSQATAGAPVPGATTWTLTGMDLPDLPVKLEIQTSWNTTVFYNLAAGTTTKDAVVINFGTAVPATFNLRVLAAITSY